MFAWAKSTVFDWPLCTSMRMNWNLSSQTFQSFGPEDLLNFKWAFKLIGMITCFGLSNFSRVCWTWLKRFWNDLEFKLFKECLKHTRICSGIFLLVDDVLTKVTGCLKIEGVFLKAIIVKTMFTAKRYLQGASVNPSKPFFADKCDDPDFATRPRFGPASENFVRPMLHWSGYLVFKSFDVSECN